MKHLINSNVLDLNPYKAGKPEEEVKREFNLERVIKLASNENPFTIPEHVSRAIQEEFAHLNRYPDSDSYYLKQKIAQYNSIPTESIVIGAGSVELIRMVIKTFLKPGETVLTSEKTFVFYKIAVTEANGKDALIEVPMGDDYTFDLDKMFGMINEKTRIIFIANPNNPTGTLLSKEEIHRFIEKIPEDKIVVLDNAYHEYVEDQDNYADGIQLALNRKNVIVLRTFSKIYGLAGLRIGYGIAHPDTMSFLGRVKAPFNVTRVGQAAAIASLENDDFKNKSSALNVKNRDKLFKQMKDLGLNPVPSHANFIMFFPGVDIKELNHRLLKEGIIIRPMKGFGVADAMRVSVGFEEDNDQFIEKIKKCLSEMR